MCKTYAEVAMDVVREDWEFRKSQHNPNRSRGKRRADFNANAVCNS